MLLYGDMEIEIEIELESVHLVALCVTAVFILLADHDGFRYITGKSETLNPKRVRFLHWAVMIGLGTMIVSGATLLADEPGWLGVPIFQVKMLMVAALVANAFLISKLSHVASEQSFASLSLHKKLVLLLSGAVSFSCWVGAATIGLFFL